jgi:4-amino-4-deoxy-L-arabinose transferase-like glycosyltransferase
MTERANDGSSEHVGNTHRPVVQNIGHWLQENLLRWAVVDVVLAVLAMYTGQYLTTELSHSREWGLAVLFAGLTLAILRLHMPAASRLAECLQIGLGFLICLPLALDVDNWKAWAAPRELILVWLSSVSLVTAPVLKLDRGPILSRWPQAGPWARREWGIFAALTLGALLLRVPAIETVPRPVDPDEASLALSTLSVAAGEFTDPFAVGWASHPSLQWFIMAPFSHAFGRTFLAMRLPSTVIGALAVGALYLAARAGWGRRVALLAGVLMLSSDVAIHFSRLGVNNISDSLFASGSVAALWAAASTGRPKAYALTGIGMGLAQYFYFGNRAIPFVVVCSLLLWALLDWRQLSRAWKPLLGAGLIALVVAGPLIGLWIRQPDALMGHIRLVTVPLSDALQNRAQQTDQSMATMWWHQIRDSLLVFTAVADRGSFYNSGRPMLPPISAPFFFAGLVALLVKAKQRQPASLGTLAWIVVILTLGSVLIGDAATFQRLLGLLPAAILVVAIGLDASVEALRRAQQWSLDRAKWVAYTATAIVALISTHFYFAVFNTQIVWKRADQEAIAVAALDYERLQGQGTFVLHTEIGVGADGTVYQSPIKLVAGERYLGNISQVAPDDPEPVRFYILPDRFDELPELEARFPGGDMWEYRRRADGEVLLVRYTVPSDSP